MMVSVDTPWKSGARGLPVVFGFRVLHPTSAESRTKKLPIRSIIIPENSFLRFIYRILKVNPHKRSYNGAYR